MEPRIERTPDGYRLRASILLPRPRAECFPFFADCHNLGRITPDDLHFSILTPDPIEMRQGLRIDYRIRLGGFPFRWRTEITAWDPPLRFVDEQRSGPYRTWVHAHEFADEGDATRMTDHVDFRAPGGRLVHDLWVNRKVEEIFRYRAAALGRLFAPAASLPASARIPTEADAR